MKNAAKFFVIVGSALLLAMVAPCNSRVNGNVKVLNANQPVISPSADGGVPFPPPPPTPTGTGLSFTTARSTTLRADGGVPFPPPPTSVVLHSTAIKSVRSQTRG